MRLTQLHLTEGYQVNSRPAKQLILTFMCNKFEYGSVYLRVTFQKRVLTLDNSIINRSFIGAKVEY